MKLVTTSSKVTGIPGTSGWVQAYDFSPEDEALKIQKGHLFIVVALVRSENAFQQGLDSIILGREFVGKIQERYYDGAIPRPFEALKFAVSESLEEYKNSFAKIEVTACSVVGDVVYSVALGGGEVVIYRDGMLATILTSQGNQVIASSGFPKANDILLLGTDSIFRKISFSVTKEVIEGKNTDEISETFSTLIHERTDSYLTGIIVIGFNEENVFSQTIQAPSTIPQTSEKIQLPKVDIQKTISPIFNFFKKNTPERRIFIRGDDSYEGVSKGRKTTLTVGILLLTLLFVSIGFGIKQKNSNNLKSKYMTKVNEANHLLDEADGLGGVDKARSRELFIASEKLYQDILSVKAKDEKIDTLGKRIDEERGNLLGEYNSPPEMFSDLSLLTANFKGERLSFSKDTVYVLDPNSNKLVSVGVSNKKSKVVATGDVLSGAKGFTTYEDRVFVLTEDGISEIVGGTKKESVQKSWNGDALIKAYTGNLYVVDKEESQIYRYQGYLGSFSAKQNWLSSSTTASFKNAREISIDGAMYVLQSGTKIAKYSLGSPQAFSTGNTSPEIKNIDSVYTNDECKYLYVLDKENGRVLVLDKGGEYVAQYRDEGIKNVSALVASEKDKKIILLTGDKLLSLEIKNI